MGSVVFFLSSFSCSSSLLTRLISVTLKCNTHHRQGAFHCVYLQHLHFWSKNMNPSLFLTLFHQLTEAAVQQDFTQTGPVCDDVIIMSSHNNWSSGESLFRRLLCMLRPVLISLTSHTCPFTSPRCHSLRLSLHISAVLKTGSANSYFSNLKWRQSEWM